MLDKKVDNFRAAVATVIGSRAAGIGAHLLEIVNPVGVFFGCTY